MMQFANIPMDRFWSADQWTYIRKNIGEWRGSFIQFSPTAARVSDTPSVLTLTEDRPGQHMALVLKRTPPGQSTHTMERDLGYPGAIPYICFFPTGAFSQGAMQRRSWSSFGAECSLLADDCRLRLVQLYSGNASGDHTLDYVTLIPEYRSPRAGENLEKLKSHLDMETVLGTWQGDSLYLSATMDNPQVGVSHWQAQRVGDILTLSLGSETQPQQFTAIDRHRWQAVGAPRQLWLLPGDVSCMVYPHLPRHHHARLELCWYLSSERRQRLVRDYDADGNWVGTSLMLENRI
ncbi:MAG: DUF3598 family protein [Cyanobacteria bacterium P01_D01_bin.2]